MLNLGNQVATDNGVREDVTRGSFQSTMFSFIFIYLFFAHVHVMWDLSSPTRDLTHAPCTGSMKS